MRKELKILISLNLIIVLSALYYALDLVILVIDDTSRDALTSQEVNPPTPDPRPDQIPKIIHQTYKTEDIPDHWKEGQENCMKLHPDWQYILWTDEMALNFIKDEYPWFLETYQSYKYNIERVDSLRYFILLKYGGIYIDLDDGCRRSLDPLVKVPAWLRKTSPVGISNDAMGFVPGHPFLVKVVNRLSHYNKNWYIPYATIMASTGPLFLSVIWEQYKRWNFLRGLNSEDFVIRVLQPEDYKLGSSAFFTISRGSSWHTSEADFVELCLTHILSCITAGFVLGFFILYGEFVFYHWLCTKDLNFDFNLSALGKVFLGMTASVLRLLGRGDSFGGLSDGIPLATMNNGAGDGSGGGGGGSANANANAGRAGGFLSKPLRGGSKSDKMRQELAQELRKQKARSRKDSNVMSQRDFTVDLEKHVIHL